jgi:hypothetical protein
MKCSKCGLLNPPTALRCDCGWDFASNTMKESYLKQTTSSSAGAVVAEGRFLKKRVKPIKQYGQYRGNGRLEVNETGLNIIGKHVYSLGARWGFGLALVVAILVLTFGTFAPGILLIYPIVEYWWLKKEDLAIPLSAITDLATDDSKQLVAVSFEGHPWCSPVVLKSPNWKVMADKIRPHV